MQYHLMKFLQISWMHQMMNDVENNLETLQRMMHFSFAQSVFEINDFFIHFYDLGILK